MIGVSRGGISRGHLRLTSVKGPSRVSSIRVNQGLFSTFLRLVFGCGFEGFAALRARDFARVYLRSAPDPGQGAGAFWPGGVLDLRGLLAAWGDKVGTGRVVAHTARFIPRGT